MSYSSYGWFGRFFLMNNLEYDSFVDEFKNKINNLNSETMYERLYGTSDSVLYYPKNNITDNKKSILLVTHELSRTGAPVVVLDMAKVLVNNGYFVTVISLIEGPLLEEFSSIGVPVIVMPDMKKVQYSDVASSLLFPKMDLDVFVNGFDLTIMVTATLFNFVRRYFNTDKKIIWWIHEGSASYNFLDRYMPKFVTPNIKVFCGGEYAVNQLFIHKYHYYPRILNYGVYDEVKGKNNKKKDSSSEVVKFLLAGSVGERKGQLILLEAIKRLPLEYKNKTEFILVGEPCDGDILGEDIMNNIVEYASSNDNVKVIRSVPREELYEMYKKIDVLVLTSIDDPMPVVATENFMLSNICLCSSMTGTSYYIEDGLSGFVFESGNISDLLKKIIYIVDNRDKLSYIKNQGRKIYEKYFEISIFEKNILKLVEEEVK